MPVSARAAEPFRFYDRFALTLATGRRARTAKELAEGIIAAPEASIYHHTHRFLAEHQYLVPEPPNDFAYWATNILQDEELGERLAGVDAVGYTSLGALRAAFVSVIEPLVGRGGRDRPVPDGKEFHFLSAKRFSVQTPHVARNLTEFAAELKRVSISSLYLHLFESRLRLPEGANDFSVWFESLGEEGLAREATAHDPYNRTLEGVRRRLLTAVEERIHAKA
jgi:hypothetical protein